MSDLQLVALLDARLVPPTSALLRPDDAGVVRGDGIFETMLVVDGRPRDLPEHLDRLVASAFAMDLQIPSAPEWERGIGSVLAAWTGGDMVLRLAATRGFGEGPTCYVTGATVAPTVLAQRRDGVRVVTLDRGFTGVDVAKAPWLLAGAKTISYAVNMAAIRYATAHDADDVIFVGSDGAVLEAPTSTVIVQTPDDTLVTPPTDGILAGITAQRLLRAARAAGHTVEQRPLSVEELRRAKGIWLTSSVRLLAAVTVLDGTSRVASPLTTVLADLLQIPAESE